MNEVGWIMQFCEKLPCNETKFGLGNSFLPRIFWKNTDVAAG